MPAPTPGRLLAELENYRYHFSPGDAARIKKLLTGARDTHFSEAPSLIRFHEVLLVLRAFPPSAGVLRQCESLLNTFWMRVDQLRAAGVEMEEFDPLEVSGIAGTTMQDTLRFELVGWLVKRLPGKVEIAWHDYDEERALSALWPRFLPLLEEDSAVEANIPWRSWLEAAQGNKSASPAWLVERFQQLPVTAAERGQVYDSLRMPVLWRLENSRISRTRNWRPVRRVFYHSGPVITRREVSLEAELARRPPALKRLTRSQSQAVMDLIREVMLVRYRELYGTTLGDPESVVHAEVGRGVSILLWNLPRERRLPLRAYVAGLTLKNGMPINYIEAIGLFEWMEVGFNTFYTFRGGEVAWIFAQALRCLCQRMGTTCISMYPYQLGHNNEEAIQSGAFWFYRKLGFRPGRVDLLRLAEREEKRLEKNLKYRTPPRTLRRLAEGHVFFELPGSQRGVWDRFSTRNLGLRVNRRMAAEFAGDVRRFRSVAAKFLRRTLKMRIPADEPSRTCFENFALVLSMAPGLAGWSASEKRGLRAIIRAKLGRDEMRYLHLLQRHDRLREVLVELGSKE